MKDKVGNLTVWLNVFKKEDDQPDYRGKMEVNGKTYSLALWVNHKAGDVVCNMSGQVGKDDGEKEF